MNQGASTGASMNQGAAANQGGTAQHTQGDQDLLEHAKHATGQIMTKVQEQAGSQINRQKETAASELSQVANAVRRIRENLPEHEAGALGRYVAEYGDKAANGLERLSHYIREQDPKKLLDDVQNFGRRQPALLLGGAFLLGFAGARLIRSSMEAGSQHQSLQRNLQTQPYTGTNVSAARPSTTPSGH